MKARMGASGTIIVEAENELEAYALRKWGEDHPGEFPGLIVVSHRFPVPAGTMFVAQKESWE